MSLGNILNSSRILPIKMKWPLFSLTAGIITVFCLTVFSNAQKAQKKEIELANVRFAVFERDLNHPTESDQKSLNFGDKLPTKFSLDVQKKLRLSFIVNDKQSKIPTVVHQSFLVLTHAQKGSEIVFVAEPDKNAKAYTVELDMKVHGKDFGGMNGLYTAHLILGDATITNPINWHFCDLSLTVPLISIASMPKSSQVNYDVLPEIRYVFREPEARPPVLVSDIFAVVCALPLLLLLILWFRIGFNFGKFKFSFYALGFHLGLCAVFGLYICFWLQLNMFQTLKWLVVVGGPTLFFATRLAAP